MTFSAKLVKSESGNWWDEDASMIIDDLASYLTELPPGATIVVECDDAQPSAESVEPAKRGKRAGT